MAKVQHICTGCVPIDATIIEVYTQLISTQAQAQEAAERAEYAAEHAIGKSPYIGENGDWWEWNDEQGVFIDTGVQAQSSIAVDYELSTTSTNPVQNRVITQALNQKYVKPATGIPASDIAPGVIPDVSQFITASVNNLVNYYLKSETYNKTEVDSLIAAVSQFSYEVVASLPTASASTMYKIYLVPSAEPKAQNVKDEYITIRSGSEGSYTYAWEQIGSTAIDLSGYVTTEQLNTALSAYTTTANLTTLLAAKQDVISDLATIRSGAAAGATAYQKPGSGISKTDLESGVQASLELADSAIQARPMGEIDPTITPADYATKEELDELEAKVSELEYLHPIAIKKGTLINTNSGSEMTSATLNATDFIDISGYNKIAYTRPITTDSAGVWGTVFYNSSKSRVSGIPCINSAAVKGYAIETVDIPANAQYVRFTMYASVVNGRFFFCDPTRDGSERRIAEIIQEIQAQKNKTDYLIISKSANLINPDDVVPGYIDSNGNDTALSGYVRTQNHIAVEAGTSYKLLESEPTSHTFRRITFYNSSKAKISDQDSSASFTTPANTAFVRVAWSASYGKKPGLFKATETNYSPFYNVLSSVSEGSYEDLPDTAIVRKKELTPILGRVSSLEEQLNGDGDITFVKNGNDLSFSIGSDELLASLDKNATNYYGGNHETNFIGWSYNTDGNNSADNVAPIHIRNTTIGANHGWGIPIATITSHGLTNADVGGEFNQNGKKFYLLRVVDANRVWLMSENIGTGTDTARNTLDVGTIQYNGNTYTISAKDSAQLYPSLSNLQKTILLNGEKKVATDGTFSCNFVDIIEEYDIMDADSIVSNLIANYGNTEPPVYEGDAIYHIRNTYRITANEDNITVIVSETILPQTNASLQNYMFAQEQFQEDPENSTWYLPNSKEYNENFVTPGTWDVQNSVFVNSNYWADADTPVNRVLSFTTNVCFAIGFLATMGVGANLKNLTNNTFELRGGGSGKIYPHGVEGVKVGTPTSPGDIFTGVLYKCYSKKLNGDRIAFYHFPFDGKEYVFVDYRTSCIDRIELGAGFNGKVVSVVESRNAVAKSDVYNNGVDIVANYVSGETCYIVFTIG